MSGPELPKELACVFSDAVSPSTVDFLLREAPRIAEVRPPTPAQPPTRARTPRARPGPSISARLPAEPQLLDPPGGPGERRPRPHPGGPARASRRGPGRRRPPGGGRGRHRLAPPPRDGPHARRPRVGGRRVVVPAVPARGGSRLPLRSVPRPLRPPRRPPRTRRRPQSLDTLLPVGGVSTSVAQRHARGARAGAALVPLPGRAWPRRGPPRPLTGAAARRGIRAPRGPQRA